MLLLLYCISCGCSPLRLYSSCRWYYASSFTQSCFLCVPPPPLWSCTDTPNMPLKKNWILFTVIFSRLTIQMIYRPTLHRHRIYLEPEASWRLCDNSVWQLWQTEGPWMPQQPPLLLLLLFLLLLSDSLLSSPQPKQQPIRMTACFTQSVQQKHPTTRKRKKLLKLVRTLLKSFMLVAWTGVPMKVR